jgi:hypothetical protein
VTALQDLSSLTSDYLAKTQKRPFQKALLAILKGLIGPYRSKPFGLTKNSCPQGAAVSLGLEELCLSIVAVRSSVEDQSHQAPEDKSLFSAGK